jgi:hypothetical protein
MMAWCIWLLLAPLLLLHPARRPLSTDGAPSISNRVAADSVLLPQHARMSARAAYRERTSGESDNGPDLIGVTIPSLIDCSDRHSSVPRPPTIAPVRDFLSCRTAHPRAPPGIGRQWLRRPQTHPFTEHPEHRVGGSAPACKLNYSRAYDVQRT